MKPASMKKFDWLYLGSIAVGLLGLLLNYGTLSAQAQAEFTKQGLSGMEDAMLLGGVLFGVAISLAIWFLISVLRIELVKWVLILLTAWSILTSAKSISLGFDSTMVWGLASTIMTVVAIWFLFHPDAKAWFAAKRGDSGTD